MKCGECRREIRQHEVTKMVLETVQEDGSLTFYGFTQPDGTWAERTGKPRFGWHWKCWNVVRKRNERTGDTSRSAEGAIPTAYSMTGGDTSFLTERNQRILDLAEEMKVGTDSWTVRELLRAIDKGVVIKEQWGLYVSDGYDHTHSLPVVAAGLYKHLQYGHGYSIGSEGDNAPEDIEHHSLEELKRVHQEHHAWMSSKTIEQSRVDDPGREPEPGADLEWPAGGTSTVEL